MEQFAARKDWTGVQSVEFIPDLPARRRMVLYLERGLKAAEAHAGLKQNRVVETTAIVSSKPSNASNASLRTARAVPVDKMPDVYDLFAEDGTPVGRASVQQFRLSQILRSVKDLWVTVEWRAEFEGYEITGQV
jgi:hypothetical protein